jgi:hypothetical protein
MCFDFFLQLLLETFLILIRTERDMIEIVHRSSCKVPVILVRLSWNFLKILEKHPNIKFHQNPSSGSRAVPCIRIDTQTDRHTKLTVTFCYFVNAPKHTDAGNGTCAIQTVHVSYTLAFWKFQREKFCCQKFGVQDGQSSFSSKTFPKGKSVLDTYSPPALVTSHTTLSSAVRDP